MSDAKDWDSARREWSVLNIYKVDGIENAEQCLCGHYPIMELCYIHNKKTESKALVGNCCVKKFMGIDLNQVFDGLKRIMKDDSKAANAAVIEHCYGNDILTDWEYEFCNDTKSKRSLTVKQLSIRKRINQKVISSLLKKKVK